MCEHIPRDIFSTAILPCAWKRAEGRRSRCVYSGKSQDGANRSLDCAAMSAVVKRARVNRVRDDLTLGVKNITQHAYRRRVRRYP